MENNWLNLVNLLKGQKYWQRWYTTWKTKKIFNELVEEKSFEFQNLKKKLILIIWYIGTKLKEWVRKTLVIKKIW